MLKSVLARRPTARRSGEAAPPGGICVSHSVQDQIGDRHGVAFEDLGEQSLKNIARPVRVYRVRLGEEDQAALARAGAAASPE